MKIRLTSFVFLFLFMNLSSLLAQDIAGDWYGTLEVVGNGLPLVFHIKKDQDKLSATMDSPKQGAKDIPVKETSLAGDQLTLKMPDLGLEYTGKVSGGQIEGTFKQGTFSAPLKLSRDAGAAAVAAPKRPQEPKAPFPYQEVALKFPNAKAGITLSGTLTVPEGKGPFPAVIMISGSGPQNRNEELLGHKPFLIIADYLTRQGFAVFRYDDRGVAESTGDFSKATSADFTDDAESALNFLLTRPEIDSKKIGFAGHSEGGLIAPMVAARNKKTAFIILLAGPGVNGEEILKLQQRLIGEKMGESEKDIALSEEVTKKASELLRKNTPGDQLLPQLQQYGAERIAKELPDATDAQKKELMQGLAPYGTPWFQYFLIHEPAPELQKCTCPVLALNGGKDLQVDPKQNLPAIKAALSKSKNKHILIKELPGLNHLFQTTETGSPAEYAKNEETFSPIALQEMSSWLKTLFK
jgi:pimeloyl-ACP methyl ester carboxylesterase